MGIVVRRGVGDVLPPIDIEGIGAILAERVLFDANNFAPFDRGVLRFSGRVADNNSIIWDVSYARRLYFGDDFLFRQGAQGGQKVGARWFEVAKSAYGDKWIELAKHLIRENLGR